MRRRLEVEELRRTKQILARGLVIVAALLVTTACFATEPSWNPADAAKDAEKDIKASKIQFYWSGSVAEFPVGVPFEFAIQYPKADAGVGCVTNNIPLRERQEKYARAYNEKMYEFVSKNPEVGKLKH